MLIFQTGLLLAPKPIRKMYLNTFLLEKSSTVFFSCSCLISYHGTTYTIYLYILDLGPTILQLWWYWSDWSDFSFIAANGLQDICVLPFHKSLYQISNIWPKW